MVMVMVRDLEVSAANLAQIGGFLLSAVDIRPATFLVDLLLAAEDQEVQAADRASAEFALESFLSALQAKAHLDQVQVVDVV